MRIFYLCGDRGIAPDGTKGASVHLRSLARALVRAGHEVVLLTRRTPGDRAALPCPWGPLDLPASVDEAARRFGAPDLLLERYALGQRHGLAAARESRLPFALEVNAPLVLEAGRHRGGGHAPEDFESEGRLFRGADLVLAVSRPLRDYVARIRGTEEGTAVLRNGFDAELFPESARQGGTRGAGATLGFLGNPRPWHGAESLPILVARLVERGRDARLLVIGGGRGTEAVARAAAVHGVEDRVEITGPLGHAGAVERLAGVSLAVAPYPHDPFFYFCPLKVIESMAAGLPLVSTALGDLPEMVGDAGVLVPPDDSEAFLEAVDHLLANEDLREELGRRARKRALDGWTWDHTAASLIEQIRALERRRGSAA